MSVQNPTCPHCGGGLCDIPAVRGLTPRQADVFRYMVAYTVENGLPPTYQEIADHFGYSSLATVHEHLGNLVDAGVVVRAAGFSARSTVPVLGAA